LKDEVGVESRELRVNNREPGTHTSIVEARLPVSTRPSLFLLHSELSI